MTTKILQVKVVWLVDIKVIELHHIKKKQTIITMALRNMLGIKFGMKEKEIQLLSCTELLITRKQDQLVKQLNSSNHQLEHLMG